MNTSASFYRLDTGELTGRMVHASSNLEAIAADACPPGCGWVPGRHDRSTHRVDLSTGEVVPRVA